MSATPDVIDQICELAERDGERPPAPSWYHGAYPAIMGCNADRDPMRGFERRFDTGFRGCYVDIYCDDLLTAEGVQRGTTVVHVDAPVDGCTPEQARALAAALLEAANVAGEVQR